MDADDPRIAVGSLVAGRYRIESLAGQGGLGHVYRAWQEDLNRPVAVKVLRPEAAEYVVARQRLLNEARAAGRLRHANVVSIYDFGASGDELFIAMEWIDGLPLSALPRPLPADRIVALLEPVCAGL
ncbi:MAG: serine/threonine protein kinase, partial [Myxococcota bacterium]